MNIVFKRGPWMKTSPTCRTLRWSDVPSVERQYLRKSQVAVTSFHLPAFPSHRLKKRFRLPLRRSGRAELTAGNAKVSESLSRLYSWRYVFAMYVYSEFFSVYQFFVGGKMLNHLLFLFLSYRWFSFFFSAMESTITIIWTLLLLRYFWWVESSACSYFLYRCRK